MKREYDALHQIYNNLHNGIVYGEYITNVTYPYFSEQLYLHPFQNCICYSHYGSSAISDNITDLNWLLKTIFETTAENFIATHICEHSL